MSLFTEQKKKNLTLPPFLPLSLSSTKEEREQIQKEKEVEYFVYKSQWQAFTPEQLENFKKFRTRVTNIEKDALRTDRFGVIVVIVVEMFLFFFFSFF